MEEPSSSASWGAKSSCGDKKEELGWYDRLDAMMEEEFNLELYGEACSKNSEEIPCDGPVSTAGPGLLLHFDEMQMGQHLSHDMKDVFSGQAAPVSQDDADLGIMEDSAGIPTDLDINAIIVSTSQPSVGSSLTERKGEKEKYPREDIMMDSITISITDITDLEIKKPETSSHEALHPCGTPVSFSQPSDDDCYIYSQKAKSSSEFSEDRNYSFKRHAGDSYVCHSITLGDSRPDYKD